LKRSRSRERGRAARDSAVARIALRSSGAAASSISPDFRRRLRRGGRESSSGAIRLVELRIARCRSGRPDTCCSFPFDGRRRVASATPRGPSARSRKRAIPARQGVAEEGWLEPAGRGGARPRVAGGWRPRSSKTCTAVALLVSLVETRAKPRSGRATSAGASLRAGVEGLASPLLEVVDHVLVDGWRASTVRRAVFLRGRGGRLDQPLLELEAPSPVPRGAVNLHQLFLCRHVGGGPPQHFRGGRARPRSGLGWCSRIKVSELRVDGCLLACVRDETNEGESAPVPLRSQFPIARADVRERSQRVDVIRASSPAAAARARLGRFGVPHLGQGPGRRVTSSSTRSLGFGLPRREAAARGATSALRDPRPSRRCSAGGQRTSVKVTSILRGLPPAPAGPAEHRRRGRERGWPRGAWPRADARRRCRWPATANVCFGGRWQKSRGPPRRSLRAPAARPDASGRGGVGGPASRLFFARASPARSCPAAFGRTQVQGHDLEPGRLVAPRIRVGGDGERGLVISARGSIGLHFTQRPTAAEWIAGRPSSARSRALLPGASAACAVSWREGRERWSPAPGAPWRSRWR